LHRRQTVFDFLNLDKEIVVWELKSKPVFGSQNDRIVSWFYFQQLYGHSSDVLDLKWASDFHLITASIDNTAIIWGRQTETKTKKIHCTFFLF
jgi:WD40 repeat protein